MNISIAELLEDVVERAWVDEEIFHEKVFNNPVERTADVCQGLSRLIWNKVLGCFPNSYMMEFEVRGKPHIIVYVTNDSHSYIVDGTIKQFLPKEEKTVFYLNNYPFKEEILNSKRRLI